MAVVNILAKTDASIDWESLLNQYSAFDVPYIAIFPIPKELGFDSDSIGINVHRGYDDKSIVLANLKKVCDLFESYKFKLVELYDGVEISSENFVTVLKQLLPDS